MEWNYDFKDTLKRYVYKDKRTVGRPKIAPEKRRKVLSVSIPQKLITALRNRATQDNGISSIVEQAIRQFLDIRS